MPAKASLPAPAQASRPFDVSVVVLSIFLSGFLLARFAAPFFALLPACTFRQVAGVPCPSCGATRACVALAQGDFVAALSYNPLVVIAFGMLFGWSVCRVFEKWSGKSVSGRFLKMAAEIFGARFASVKFTMQQRLRWLVVGAIILNWIYLIVAAL